MSIGTEGGAGGGGTGLAMGCGLLRSLSRGKATLLGLKRSTPGQALGRTPHICCEVPLANWTVAEAALHSMSRAGGMRFAAASLVQRGLGLEEGRLPGIRHHSNLETRKGD